MRTLIAVSAVFLSFIVVSGCATQSAEDPRTLYLSSDFTERGVARTLQQYDYSKEHAPCTALDGYDPVHSRSEEFYEASVMVQGKVRNLLFVCRPLPHTYANHRRLFLVGSSIECSHRTWDHAYSTDPYYVRLYRLCTEYQPPRTVEELAARYHSLKLVKSYEP